MLIWNMKPSCGKAAICSSISQSSLKRERKEKIINALNMSLGYTFSIKKSLGQVLPVTLPFVWLCLQYLLRSSPRRHVPSFSSLTKCIAEECFLKLRSYNHSCQIKLKNTEAKQQLQPHRWTNSCAQICINTDGFHSTQPHGNTHIKTFSLERKSPKHSPKNCVSHIFVNRLACTVFHINILSPEIKTKSVKKKSSSTFMWKLDL